MPRWFILLIAGLCLAGASALAIVPITIHSRNKARAAVARAQSLYDAAKMDLENGCAEIAASKMNDALVILQPIGTTEAIQLGQAMTSDLASAKSIVERERAARVAREERAKQEAKERAELEARDRQERERAEAAARKQAEEEQKAAAKAREMYPEYKKSAELVADTLLKFLSATESSVTLEDHRRFLQDLVFVYNKLDARCSAAEKQYKSYLAISLAVTGFKRAQSAWDLKVKVAMDTKGESLSTAEAREELFAHVRPIAAEAKVTAAKRRVLAEYAYNLSLAVPGSKEDLALLQDFAKAPDGPDPLPGERRSTVEYLKRIDHLIEPATGTYPCPSDSFTIRFREIHVTYLVKMVEAYWEDLKPKLIKQLEATLQDNWRSARKARSEAMAALADGK